MEAAPALTPPAVKEVKRLCDAEGDADALLVGELARRPVVDEGLV